MRPYISILIASCLLTHAGLAGAWGDEGHEIVGLIAEHYLKPGARTRVAALLAGDASALTHSTDLPTEATWADKFRDSDRNTTRLRYTLTNQWHFIDIEIDHPDPDAACFQHPRLAPGSPASAGPAADCIWDKIDEFRAELANPATAPDERRLALQFLLHLVGDAHQPLHAADHHDRGGNDLHVKAAGSAAGNLHHYWDTVFVKRLGADPNAVAARLIAGISPRQRRAWSSGTTRDWIHETFEISRRHTYGRLPQAGAFVLDAGYTDDAEAIVAVQLQRAGVRLAHILNGALR